MNYFTPTENEVFERLEVGMTNKQIARALNRSVDTIRHHCRSISGKMGEGYPRRKHTGRPKQDKTTPNTANGKGLIK